jgi:hypothetical protein
VSDEVRYTRRELLEGMRLHEILEEVAPGDGDEWNPPVFAATVLVDDGRIGLAVDDNRPRARLQPGTRVTVIVHGDDPLSRSFDG